MNDEGLLEEIRELDEKIKQAVLPDELREKVNGMLIRLSRSAKGGQYSNEYEQIARYINWIVNLPWTQRSEDSLNLNQASTILDKNHHGLHEIKERILEYLSVLKLTASAESISGKGVTRAPILCLVGLVGTGKTTLAYSVAESMGRKFERIPFGGIGDALYLRGQSRAYPEAEPGQIIKALKRAGTKNPVILLDEIDRVAENARTTIMGVLVELLDPEQNSRFTDHYIDYPFDLSEVLFIATTNNTGNISTAVLDRLEPLSMPSYTDADKIAIAKDFVLPKMIKELGLPANSLMVADEVWPKIVRPLGFDAGIRTLERTLYNIGRKVAKMVVEGKAPRVALTAENVKEYLPTW